MLAIVEPAPPNHVAAHIGRVMSRLRRFGEVWRGPWAGTGSVTGNYLAQTPPLGRPVSGGLELHRRAGSPRCPRLKARAYLRRSGPAGLPAEVGVSRLISPQPRPSARGGAGVPVNACEPALRQHRHGRAGHRGETLLPDRESRRGYAPRSVTERPPFQPALAGLWDGAGDLSPGSAGRPVPKHRTGL